MNVHVNIPVRYSKGVCLWGQKCQYMFFCTLWNALTVSSYCDSSRCKICPFSRKAAEDCLQVTQHCGHLPVGDPKKCIPCLRAAGCLGWWAHMELSPLCLVPAEGLWDRWWVCPSCLQRYNCPIHAVSRCSLRFMMLFVNIMLNS